MTFGNNYMNYKRENTSDSILIMHLIRPKQNTHQSRAHACKWHQFLSLIHTCLPLNFKLKLLVLKKHTSYNTSVTYSTKSLTLSSYYITEVKNAIILSWESKLTISYKNLYNDNLP